MPLIQRAPSHIDLIISLLVVHVEPAGADRGLDPRNGLSNCCRGDGIIGENYLQNASEPRELELEQ